MANNDFTIRLKTEVVKGDADSQIDSIIKDIEKKSSNIQVGLDINSLKNDIKELKEVLGDLKSLKKETITINVKDSALKKETDEAKELISRYKKLIKEKEALQKSLIKLDVKGQPYNKLKKELKSVTNEIENVEKSIDGLDKKKFKSDMTKTLSLAFESVTKQVNTLSSAMDNAIKNKDFGEKYLANLKRLRTNMLSYTEGLDLAKIINSEKAFEEMSKITSKVDEFSDKFNNLKIDNAFANKIEKAHTEIDALIRKVTDLYTTGYGNTKGLDAIIKKLEGLKSRNIDINSSDASNKFKKLSSDIASVKTEISKTESQMNKLNKIDTFKFSVEGSLRGLQKLKEQCKDDEKALLKLLDIEKELMTLKEKPTSQTKKLSQSKQKYKSLQNELKAISSEVKEIDKATASMDNFNRLLTQRANLKRQKSTTLDERASIELDKKLDKNLEKIRKIDDSIDEIQIDKITNAMIDNRLIGSFDTLQKKITATDYSLKNALQNKNLTKDQVTALKEIEHELDNLRGLSLEKMLNSDRPNEEIRKIVVALDGLGNKVKEINIDNTFTNKLERLTSTISGLDLKMDNLKQKGFVGNDDLKDLEDLLNLIKKTTSSLETSTDAAEEYREAMRLVAQFDNKYNSLSSVSTSEKNAYNIETNKQKLLDDLTSVRKYYDELSDEMKNNILKINADFGDLDKLEQGLKDLINLPIGEQDAKIKRFANTLGKLKETSKNFKEDAEQLRVYNRLLAERDDLELKLSKALHFSMEKTAYEEELKKINNEIAELEKKMKNVSSEELSPTLLKGYTREISNIETELDKLSIKMRDAFADKNLTQKQEATFNKLKTNIVNAKKDLDKVFGDFETAILNNERPPNLYRHLQLLVNVIKTVDSEFKDLEKTVEKTFNMESDLEKTQARLEDLLNTIETFTKLSAYNNYTDLKNLKGDVQALLNSSNIDFDSAKAQDDLRDLSRETKECVERFEELKTTAGIGLREDKLANDLKNTERDLKDLREEIIKLGNSTQEIDDLILALQQLNNVSVSEASNEVSRVRKEMSYISKETTRLKREQQQTVRTQSTKLTNNLVSDIYRNISMYTIGDILGDQIMRGIGAVSDTIIELDSAFRDLQKVAPATFSGTSKELKQLREEAYLAGQEVARSSVDIINSTASALQLGIDNIKDAMQYAKQVNMYANVADLSEEDADRYVKSIASAYGGIAESLKPMRKQIQGASQDYSMLTDYMDQANYAGNNYAVTSADVGEALMRSASQLRANGNSMSQSIGMIIGANETVQDASRVGNAMKSLAVNLNGVTFSAREGKVTLNKTAKALKTIAGIDVMENQNGEIKTGFEVLDELSKKWNDLNDVQQAAIAEALGQKYHANTLIAMLDNWETVLQYQDEYNRGFTVGSMATENERYIDSLEGRIVNLKEQFKSLLNTVITTDMAKDSLGGLASVLETLNNGLKGLDGIGMATPTAISSLVTMFQMLKASAAGDNYGKMIGNFIPALRTLTAEEKKNIIETAKATNSKKQLVKAYGEAYVKNGLVTLGVGLLNGALMTLAITGISAAIKAWDDYVNKSKRAREELEQLQNVTKEEISTLSGSLSSVKKMATRYDELSKKTNRTAEETEELISYQQQLADQFPELVIDYDSNGNPLLDLSNGLDDVIKKLETAIEQKNKLLRQQNAELGITAGKEVEEQNYRQTDEQRRGLYTGSKYGEYKSTDKDLYKIFLNESDNFEDAMNKYIERVKKYDEKIKIANNGVKEKVTAYYKAEAIQETAALEEFLNNQDYSSYKKLGNSQKRSVKDLISSFEWSNELVANDIAERDAFLKQGFAKIAEHANVNAKEVEIWNKQIKAAGQAYQKTGDIEAYRKSLEGVGVQLEVLTGISAEKWVIGFTQQLKGELDGSSIAFDNFLKGFNFSIEDYLLGDNDTVSSLKNQFDKLQEMLSHIRALTSTEQRMKFFLDVAQGETFTQLPPQLNALITGAFDDRTSVSDKTLGAMVTISTYIEQYGQLEGEAKTAFEKAINGELTKEDAALTVGITLKDGTKIPKEIFQIINDENKDQDKKYKVSLDVDESGKTRSDEILKKLKEFDKINSRKEIKQLFTVETLNVDKAEYIEKLMDRIRTNPELTIQLVKDNVDILNSFNSYKEVIQWLLNNPHIVTKYEIDLIKDDVAEKAIEQIDSLFKTDKEKKIKKDIELGISTGDLDSLNTALGKLDEEKKIKVAAEISDVLKKFGGIEEKTFAEKIVEVNIKEKKEEDSETLEEQIDRINKLAAEKSEKKVQFTEVGFSNTEGRLIQIDEKTGKPKFAEINFLTYGYSKTKEEEEEISEGAEDENKDITITNKDYGTVTGELTKINEGAEDENKDITLGTVDYATTLDRLEEIRNNSKPEKKTIWISIAEATKGAIDWLNRLFSKGVSKVGGINSYGSSVGDFTDISDSPVQAMSTPDVSAMETPTEGDVSASAITPSSIDGGVSVKSADTLETKIELNFDKMIYAIKNSIKYFQELENRISKVSNEISSLGAELDRAVGTERISILQRQNALYDEQIKLQKQYHSYLSKEKQALQKNLRTLGFTFNAEGNLTSYEERLISMTKQLESLDKAYEKAQKKENSYTGSSKSKQKAYSKATEKAQKKRDDYQKKLEEAKTLSDAYLSLQFTELADLEEEWKKLTNTIKENNDEIEKLLLEDKLYKSKNMITELTTNYESLNKQIDLLDAKIKRVSGKQSLPYYKERNALLQEQLDLTSKNIKEQEKLGEEYRKTLEQRYGFEFTSTGDFVNLDEVLNKYQNSEDIELLKEIMEEYIDIQNGEIPNLKQQWEDLGESIQETNFEIEKIELEDALYKHKNAVKALEQEYQRLENIISLNSIKLQSLNDSNKIDIYNIQIKAMREQREVLAKEIEEYKKQISQYAIDLEKYGFELSQSGDVLNMDTVLNKYQDTKVLENVTSLLEEYLELQGTELPNAINSWEKLGNSIQDIYKDKLTVVKDIEDKITQIYEDEIEKRKKKIEDEKEELVKSLQEQKDAYQKYRSEVEYKNEMEEQLDKISKINSKIALLERDNSLSARAKIETLREELEKENKTLEEMRQNQLDKKIEEMYDNQIKKAEDDAESKTKDLEDEWSLEKISQYVKDAIDTGYFENIDGQVVNLKDKMIEFAEESGEALGIMGDTIKNELVGNLVTARDILDEYPEIFNSLGLKQYGEEYKEGINKTNKETSSINVDSINISVVSDNPKDVSKEIAKSIETELGYIANNL